MTYQEFKDKLTPTVLGWTFQLENLVGEILRDQKGKYSFITFEKEDPIQLLFNLETIDQAALFLMSYMSGRKHGKVMEAKRIKEYIQEYIDGI